VNKKAVLSEITIIPEIMQNSPKTQKCHCTTPTT